MRHLILTIALVLAAVTGQAQTLNVSTDANGSVLDQYSAAKVGDMTFTNGEALTILGKTYNLSEITKLYTDDSTAPKDNNVNIVYSGTGALVYVAGNVAPYVKVTVSGAHVSIDQSNEADVDGDEITYALSGSSDDGEFALSGAYKCTVSLAGVTLTNPKGAAININNKKRIQVSAKKGTDNVLADGTGGKQKGCIYSKGQIQLQGNGTLTVTGNTSHAIKSGDYITVKNLTLTIPSAVKDGINCNKYFQMKSGSVTISGVGDDGIQSSYEEDDDATGETTDHEDENSANLYVDGGTLNVSVPSTSVAGKCLKADGNAIINGGKLTLSAAAAVDATDTTDPSYTSCIKGTSVTINDGDITCTVTGTAGRGVSADDTLTTNGGTLTITNSGAPTTIAGDVKSAKGLKALNLALNAGTITINMSGNASKAIASGDGTKVTTSGGGGPGGGTSTTYTNVTGSHTQGLPDGTDPTLTISQTGQSYNSSSAKAIKAICAITIYGGTTEVTTTSDGAEGLESKTSIDIRGGQHYFQCYDDCINSAGQIVFNGGVTVCYSSGNDAVDSNYGKTGAITIGDGAVLAYTSRGQMEEGLDCDNHSYIQITGNGYAISAGGSQGGGGGGGGPWGGGSSNTISNAAQGYYFYSGSNSGISFQTGKYYTLSDASGNNLVTFSFAANCNSTLSLFTAKGMVKDSKYNIKSSATEPTDAATAFHGLYLGSSATGTTSVLSNFTAK